MPTVGALGRFAMAHNKIAESLVPLAVRLSQPGHPVPLRCQVNNLHLAERIAFVTKAFAQLNSERIRSPLIP